MTDIEYVHDRDAAQIAQWLGDRIAERLAAKDTPVAICVPGGSTPFPIFAELVKRDLDFARLEIWPNDDRIVPEDHEASNTGKIRALFEPVGAKVVALAPDLDVPAFDLVWLGMGEDGHIASLFPNIDPQTDDAQGIRVLTPDPLPPHAPFDRITLTLPALVRTDALMFVIRGEEKRAVFDAAAAGESDLPVARLLRGVSQTVTCFT
ncbi:6-phosphogluconolactonase [uncultured Erythrobacter sp.]|uniref:6-phosphogluconolactonase n=1 Tax=uncultured Erythrobacter sp. TaxID=263913 RepID=UPI002609AEEB|nr:6-phosphogluconolactonase [uncultured Erythrobacter sp.]